MSKLEVFFDYACPFCLRGHGYLEELIGQHPEIEIVWRPCEAHPRPERYGPHSDLCMQGMYYALDHGADIWAYHERMYAAALKDRADIEDIGVVTALAEGLVDTAELRRALENGEYAKVQRDGNDYAYGKSGVWAVPSYRMNGKKLDSVENVGVTKEQLANFLTTAEA